MIIDTRSIEQMCILAHILYLFSTYNVYVLQQLVREHVANQILSAPYAHGTFPPPVDTQPDRPIGYGAFGVVWYAFTRFFYIT